MLLCCCIVLCCVVVLWYCFVCVMVFTSMAWLDRISAVKAGKKKLPLTLYIPHLGPEYCTFYVLNVLVVTCCLSVSFSKGKELAFVFICLIHCFSTHS